MKDLIYYPTFEPHDLNRIKYALIYINKFSPTIPDTGRTELSELYLIDLLILEKIQELKN